jgi:hypothetical protein
MIVEAAGTAVRGTGDGSRRVHAAMEAAYLKAIEDGVNDPAEILRRKMDARAQVRARIAQEGAAKQQADQAAHLLKLLHQIKAGLEPRMTQALVSHLDAIQRALTEMETDARRRAAPLP